MRNKIVGFWVAAGVLVCTVLLTTASQAATTKVDLSITGQTVAGYTKAQYGQELPVMFTMKNRSPRTATSVAFSFTLTNATADGSDYTCPLISNHYNINPDSPNCEPGVLGHGASTSAAIMVTPTIVTGTVTVQACAEDLESHGDPVSSNNCKTVSIPID
jgi:hypothetical protein